MDVPLRHSLLPAAPVAHLAELARLIEELSGVHLPEERWITVFSRLERQIAQAGSVENYHRKLRDDRDAQQCMIDILCPHETSFFREPEQWEFLKGSVFPEWLAAAKIGARAPAIRAWSAASSTGEEPYTIAMVLLDFFGPTWDIQVLATDFSEKVLSQARAALYKVTRASEVPEHFRRKYMLQGRGQKQGLMTVVPEVASLVSFRLLNLTHGAYPASEGFDLIFCRNVLIYFSPEAKAQVAKSLLSCLAKDGLLLTGHAESLRSVEIGAVAVGPTIYQKRAHQL